MTNSWMDVLSPSPAHLSDSHWILGEKLSGIWTQQENKLFENALAHYDELTPDRWGKVAGMIPGKTVNDVLSHYHDLEDDVSCIEAGLIPFPGYTSSFTLDWEKDAGFEGLPQACYVGGKRLGGRFGDDKRKKGIPWTQDEHKRFLMGLKKYGKGDWRNISRNFVVSRTPTQVASHAQKYFIRLNSGGKDKRRASIHDITTVSVGDNRSPSPPHPSLATMQSSSTIARQGASEQSAMMVDSELPNQLASIFDSSTNCNRYMHSPFGVLPYALKMNAKLNGSTVSQSGFL